LEVVVVVVVAHGIGKDVPAAVNHVSKHVRIGS
jgi:uncharacterized pyridoxal phosphate-containing UPF0001 family protein